mmetsp:Transcript_78909/g.92231  ORF Transcript_78909/g.92231 Transcript_78909/m.92231 type:complete len:100 (-) Transcript_78909:287-586(-)
MGICNSFGMETTRDAGFCRSAFSHGCRWSPSDCAVWGVDKGTSTAPSTSASSDESSRGRFEGGWLGTGAAPRAKSVVDCDSTFFECANVSNTETAEFHC